MNCCNHNDHNDHNDNNKHGHQHRGQMGHMCMMAICCGAPIILLAVISLLGTSFPGLRTTLYSILPFLCPVMMLAMLPMMLKKNRKDDHDQCTGHDQSGDADTSNETKYLK